MMPSARHFVSLLSLTFGGCVVVAFLCAGEPDPLAGTRAATRISRASETDHVAEMAARPDLDEDAPPVPSVAPLISPISGLPQPSTLSRADFERELYPFLKERRYIALGWKVDKGVRDTGPFMDGTYYGTHPAVRVFYSPGIIAWLEGGRIGSIPDGEMMIKEQYPPPAARHDGKSEAELRASLESWTVMVKDSRGSHDGWFWSNPGANAEVAEDRVETGEPVTLPEHPESGFGLYCLRCHAATKSPAGAATNEFTFASLRNIKGYPGEPILFRVDDSWRTPQKSESESEVADNSEAEDTSAVTLHGSHPSCRPGTSGAECVHSIDPEFATVFSSIAPVKQADVQRIPPVTRDWVVQNAGGSQEFLTSNQCMSCHAGLAKPFGPTMFVPTTESASYGAPGFDVSPYGEWRWTPMGLAGRDPVFLAQLESEMTQLGREFSPDTADKFQKQVTDTCLRCHGGMGHHQFHADQLSAPHTHGKAELFSLEHHFASEHDPDSSPEHHHYGALARDGISCLMCHRQQPRPQPEDDDRPYLKYFLETSITGNIHFGPVGEVYGPFKDETLKPYVMEHATALKPKHSDYIQSSRMCGGCHTVSLPAVDHPLDAEPDPLTIAAYQLRSPGERPGHASEVHTDADQEELCKGECVEDFKGFHHHVEQATYLEWLNSVYQNELGEPTAEAKSCQDCHMSEGLSSPEDDIELTSIPTRIAAVQDRTYPDAENLAPHHDLDIPVREEGFKRHNFSGLNAFLLEMFNQHPNTLGVPTTDYMTGSTTAVDQAMRNFLQTARRKTARLAVRSEVAGAHRLDVDVHVTNLAGHRFPSGVGFRRAFLELTVTDGDRVVWSSGRTNGVGVLIGPDDQPLAEEFFESDAAGGQRYHPHREVIDSQSQVQVYETLVKNHSGRFTTSFLHGCERPKDNRLLPKGWTASGPDPESLTGPYLKATHPAGRALSDRDYADGSGSDRTTYRVTLPADVEPRNVTVTARLYYQAMPPYFLKNLFETTPDGIAAQRLHYLCSTLKLEGTPLEGWKLMVAEESTTTSEPKTVAVMHTTDEPVSAPRP